MCNKYQNNLCTIKALSNKELEKFQVLIDKLLIDPTYIENQAKEAKDGKECTNSGDLLFALLRLSQDLLIQTAFFLNEDNIFTIEKMTNNTSYLNQCKNFQIL